MNYLFIGNGRVARHMSHYLSAKGHNVTVWSRRSQVDPLPLIQKAQVICISTRDQEIRGVIEAYGLSELQVPVIHFSGSQHIEGTFGFHPLMSFGPNTYSLQSYKELHFVGTASQNDFRQCFPSFENPYHQIERSQLALYHAYCSMAGNFPQILWNEVSQKFKTDLSLPSEALHPYLKRVVQNFSEHKELSVTGPLVRNDSKTLIRHLDALNGKPLQSIYFSFINLFRKNNPVENRHESRGISSDQV